MKIGTRFIIGNLLMFGLALFFFINWLTSDMEPGYRKAAEEPLVDASRILASMAAQSTLDGKPDIAMFESAFRHASTLPLSAKIYDFIKSSVDLRVYITDNNGVVLFDSHSPENVGKDFTNWRDVELTLSGMYGARTTRDNPSDPLSSVMYVSSPIVANGVTVGVLSVGKPTHPTNLFVYSAKRKVLISALVVFVLIALVTYILSQRVVRPIALLTDYARSVRDGRKREMPSLGRDETAILGAAFEEMREALEGKKYIESYLQAFTHEVKGPISAIKGAIELLREDMPEDQRRKFIANIESETARIQQIAEKLLLLSSLENTSTIQGMERIACRSVMEDAIGALRAQIDLRDLETAVEAEDSCFIHADPFWASHCLINLLKNALDFSPQGGRVTLSARTGADGSTSISVSDEGPGIPEYALQKAHERFFSLKRPASGKKSTGLGLSIVHEAMRLHGGTLSLSNRSSAGATATITFPAR